MNSQYLLYQVYSLSQDRQGGYRLDEMCKFQLSSVF